MKTKKQTNKWGLLRKAGSRLLPLACLLSLGGGFVLPAVQVSATEKGWGPERRSFTWEQPADYRTFNSMTNNPDIGSEFNFVRVREAGVGNFTDKVVLEPGKEYEVFNYYHNNASAHLNDSGAGIAENVRLKAAFPNKLVKGQSGVVKGIIRATNAQPQEVWDEAYLHANETVYLRYVGNSATIYNQGSANGSVLDSNALFGEEGAKLAHLRDRWGMIPGCNEFAGRVIYRIKVDKPGFFIEKNASKVGDSNYQDTITVTPGETIDFKINYKNTGTTYQNRVTVYDRMPEGMKYINGTTYLKTPAATNGVFTEDKLFNGGLVIGDFRAGEQAEITYKTEIADDKILFPCGDTVIYNNSSVATENGTEYDKVKIIVKRECKDTPPKNPNETPKQLPKTGPGEVVLALVIVTGIGIGTAYYIASTRDLSKLSKKAKGKE